MSYRTNPALEDEDRPTGRRMFMSDSEDDDMADVDDGNPRGRGAIAQATDRMAKELEVLQNELEKLINHLGPVLGPDFPEEGSDNNGRKENPDESSELTKILNRYAGALRNYSDLIRRTNGRVEL